MKKYLFLIIVAFFNSYIILAQDINQKWLDEINPGKKIYKAGKPEEIKNATEKLIFHKYNSLYLLEIHVAAQRTI